MSSRSLKMIYSVASVVNYVVAVCKYVVGDYMGMAFSFFAAVWILLVGILILDK